MRVLLVKPHSLGDHIQPPLGLGFLAQSIRAHHDVHLLDCIKDRIQPADLADRVHRFRPDVVGVQCYTFDVARARRFLEAAKRASPSVVTVAGGAGVSSSPHSTMDYLGDAADFGFVGEAEPGFGRFLAALESRQTSFEGIPGVVWRSEDEYVVNAPALVHDLDSLGMPALDLIRPETYPESQHGAFYQQFPVCPVLTTRGCPYACAFCAAPILSGRELRRHSVNYLREMILTLNRRHGIRELHIVDDNFTANLDHAKDVMRMIIGLGLGLSLAMPNGIRMDRLDDELLELMKAAGVYLVSVAVESGNDDVLKSMNKRTTVAACRANIARIRRHGLDVAAFFVLGFPGETTETVRDTIDLALDLDLLRANFFTYLPLPGTKSYDALVSSGKLREIDWDSFLFMTAPYVPEHMSRSELLSLKREAFLRFYLRPKPLLQNLRRVRSTQHFRFLVRRFYHWVLMSPEAARRAMEKDR